MPRYVTLNLDGSNGKLAIPASSIKQIQPVDETIPRYQDGARCMIYADGKWLFLRETFEDVLALLNA